ncbi:MAG: acylneuraminate cytidylyltransferase family protein [Phycisphaeraceae bacterium]|nr:acylneuraminate cytidylyltransferase family protein [Phycisphaerales bacterium]MCB9859779.1 acylneuraminate cytidylyltransferase family protein [Phycisphaeraceae bacterium]
MNALAVILARAGSKGLAGKNTREIAGQPCIQWTLNHVLTSWTVGRVIVSTDCPYAIAIAQAFGARVHHRPPMLATDTAGVQESLASAVRHAIETTPSTTWHEDLPVVMLYGNVPIRPVDLTDRAVEMLARTGCDSVISVARVGKHHPWWTLRTNENHEVLPFDGDVLYHGIYRRQELPDAYIPDGGVTAIRLGTLLDASNPAHPDRRLGPHAFLGTDRRCVITDEGDVIDIDTSVDAMVAEAVLLNARPIDNPVAA